MAMDDKKKSASSEFAGMSGEKQKALTAALAQIEKQFGKGSIMRLGDAEINQDIQVVSSGSLGLDIALGVGGLARGRVIEIYGPESSGKTTLTLHAVAEMQKLGGTCAFIDAEHALDVQYAAKLGVDVNNLLISQPDTGEQALEIADALVRSGSIDLIVIDSVAALVPKAEIEGDMGDSLPGLQARLMSQALRKLTGTIKRTNSMELVRLIVPVNLRKAWLINRACKPGNESPISPSISAFGTKAATESITIKSIEPERTSASAISNACSPVSGCEINKLLTSTPSFAAYCTSSACSASINAQVPPSFCISATAWRVNVVLPDDSGP